MPKIILIFIFSFFIFISCSEKFSENELALINKMTTQERDPVELEDAQCLLRDMKKTMATEDYNKFIDILLVVDEPDFGNDMTDEESMEFMSFVMLNSAFLKKAGETCDVEMNM